MTAAEKRTRFNEVTDAIAGSLGMSRKGVVHAVSMLGSFDRLIEAALLAEDTGTNVFDILAAYSEGDVEQLEAYSERVTWTIPERRLRVVK